MKMRMQNGWGRLLAVLVVGSLGLALGAPAAAGEMMADPEITDAVEDEVLFDPAVELNNVDVETTEGVVTLTGTTDNILAKERARKLAETVKGVRAVVNRIDVDPSAYRSDAAIQNDVQAALLMDRATESYEVDVEVEDGVVTLTGAVDSWQEKQLSEKVAKGIRGVVGVENNIAVNYKTERPDSEIEQDIKKRLRWDKLVDHALVDVEVEDGNVTLTGTVGSAAEKSRAFTDAWVQGTESVDNSGLDVKWWARNDELRKDKYVVKSDEELARAVEDALLYDPRVQSFEIDADADAGMVTLRGTVDNLMAKRAAERDAENTVGVVGVVNRIRVRPSTPTDEEIAENVRQALKRDPEVDRYEINVSVVDGQVYLTGVVDSYFEKGQADDVAARVYGVTEVKNNLDVDYDDPLVYDPYLDDYDPYDYDWYDYEPGYTFLRDEEIEEEIQDEMFWSPYVDSQEVNISVEDGVATLTGQVDTWTEYDNATEEAYEGGATWVYNRMTVD
jgi:osmotically-inducible protein OsmY